MCLAVPMKVVSMDGDTGFAEMSGMKRKISFMMLPDVKIGEYVIVHAGFAIEKLNQEEALRTLNIWQEIEEFDRK